MSRALLASALGSARLFNAELSTRQPSNFTKRTDRCPRHLRSRTFRLTELWQPSDTTRCFERRWCCRACSWRGHVQRRGERCHDAPDGRRRQLGCLLRWFGGYITGEARTIPAMEPTWAPKTFTSTMNLVITGLTILPHHSSSSTTTNGATSVLMVVLVFANIFAAVFASVAAESNSHVRQSTERLMTFVVQMARGRLHNLGHHVGHGGEGEHTAVGIRGSTTARGARLCECPTGSHNWFDLDDHSRLGPYTFQAGRCYPQSEAPVINTAGLMSDTLRRTGTPQECYLLHGQFRF